MDEERLSVHAFVWVAGVCEFYGMSVSAEECVRHCICVCDWAVGLNFRQREARYTLLLFYSCSFRNLNWTWSYAVPQFYCAGIRALRHIGGNFVSRTTKREQNYMWEAPSISRMITKAKLFSFSLRSLIIMLSCFHGRRISCSNIASCVWFVVVLRVWFCSLSRSLRGSPSPSFDSFLPSFWSLIVFCFITCALLLLSSFSCSAFALCVISASLSPCALTLRG